jgi:hypothetical protein
VGSSYTPKFRVEYKTQTGINSASWEIRAFGRPTAKNAEAFRMAMNKSYQPGGTNSHLADEKTGVPHVSSVRVINQRTGRTVCMVQAPTFEVY